MPGQGSALSVLGQGYADSTGALGNAYGQTQGYLSQLGALYAPMAQGGRAAYDRYLDAVGANSADGSTRAAEAFQAGPGYQYALDQALGAVQRTAAARGGLAGGNATADILRTATGLGNQAFQQYVTNLSNAATSYGTGLAGQAQGLAGQANASQAYGNTLAGLGQTYGQNMANVFGTASGQQANFGNAVAGLQTNAANQYVQNNNNLAQAQNQASANALGLGMNLLSGGANFISGGGLSRLGNLFS